MAIERKDNYWVDDKGNKWSTVLCSEEKALICSATLIGCTNCTDCIGCQNCNYCGACSDCKECRFCTHCSGCSWCSCCRDCINCTDCTDCSYCRDCAGCHCCSGCRNCNHCNHCNHCDDCINCGYCDDCRSCMDCIDCIYCTDFEDNPTRIVGNRMGSRNDFPYVYWTEVGQEQCIVGCFRGTLNELKKAVEETHKNNPVYLTQYMKFIKGVRAYQRMMKRIKL